MRVPGQPHTSWRRIACVALALVVLLFASAGYAGPIDGAIDSPDWLQAEELPLVEPPRALPATESDVRFAYYDATTEDRTLVAPGELAPLPPAGNQRRFLPPPQGRDGMLQHLGFTKTLILGGAGDNIRFIDLVAKGTIAFPAPTTDSPLLITPAFTAHLLDGPTTVHLPERLYDTYLEFRWLNVLTPRFTLDLAFSPGIYGDYAFVNRKTWRYQARAVGVFTTSCTTQLVAGVAFIDRENIGFLPVAGFIWTPSEVWNVELVVPRPKISKQLSLTYKREWRGYVAGEFGGNSYSILQTDGYQDIATYQDLRLLLGIERRKTGGRTLYWEAGYVFARKLEFASGTPSIDPGPTALLRSGAYY